MDEQQNTQDQSGAPMGNDMPSGGNSDVEKNKGVTFLSYIGILCLVPLLANKDSQFAQFHAKQGLTLFIAWVILWVVNFIPILGQIVFVLGMIFLVILSIMGLITVSKGEMKELPVVGDFAKKLNL